LWLPPSSTPSGRDSIMSSVGSCPPFASTVPERRLCEGTIPVFLSYIMREQAANAVPIGPRGGDFRSGGDCGAGSPAEGVLNPQLPNPPFAGVWISTADFAGSCHRGPLGEAARPSEGLNGLVLVVVVARDLGGNGIVPAEGSKGVVIPLVGPVLVRGLRDHAGGTLDGTRRDTKGAIGRALIDRSVEWVMEPTGQTEVVLLRPGRGEAGHTNCERTTGESEPRGSRRRLEGLLLDLRGVAGSEGVAVDGPAFEIGFVRVVGGSRESEPRDLGDIRIPDTGNQRGVENRDNQERDGINKDWRGKMRMRAGEFGDERTNEEIQPRHGENQNGRRTHGQINCVFPN
jgi:hypothetical protein